MQTQNTNLNALEVRFAEYCLNDGFFYVLFKNGESVQCCLASHEELDHQGYSYSVYKAAISEENNGFSEGLCRDVNRWAVHNDNEWGHINDYLINAAREAGLEII